MVSLKPGIVIALIMRIFDMQGVEKLQNFLAAAVDERTHNPAAHRRDAGHAGRSAAAYNVHQDNLRIIVLVMPHRYPVKSIPIRRFMKKRIPGISPRFFQATAGFFLYCQKINTLFIIRHILLFCKGFDKSGLPVRSRPPQAVIDMGDTDTVPVFTPQSGKHVQQRHGIRTPGYACQNAAPGRQHRIFIDRVPGPGDQGGVRIYIRFFERRHRPARSCGDCRFLLGFAPRFLIKSPPADGLTNKILIYIL